MKSAHPPLYKVCLCSWPPCLQEMAWWEPVSLPVAAADSGWNAGSLWHAVSPALGPHTKPAQLKCQEKYSYKACSTEISTKVLTQCLLN